MTQRLIINVYPEHLPLDIAFPVLQHCHKYFKSSSYLEPSKLDTVHYDLEYIDPLQTITAIIGICKRNKRALTINFVDKIGEDWKVLGDLVGALERATRRFPALNITINDGSGKGFQTYKLETHVKSGIVTLNHGIEKPEDAQPCYELFIAQHKDDLLAKCLYSTPTSFVPHDANTVRIERFADFFILDDGLGHEHSTWLRMLEEEYEHITVIHHHMNDELTFMRLPLKEEVFLRNASESEIQHHSCSEYLDLHTSKLLELGLIEVGTYEREPDEWNDDETVEIFSFTEAGLAYRKKCTRRTPVHHGVCMDDYVTDTSTGIVYKVMGFDLATGLFNLMGEDSSAKQLNINHNYIYCKAYDHEIKRFMEVVLGK